MFLSLVTSLLKRIPWADACHLCRPRVVVYMWCGISAAVQEALGWHRQLGQLRNTVELARQAALAVAEFS